MMQTFYSKLIRLVSVLSSNPPALFGIPILSVTRIELKRFRNISPAFYSIDVSSSFRAQIPVILHGYLFSGSNFSRSVEPRLIFCGISRLPIISHALILLFLLLLVLSAPSMAISSPRSPLAPLNLAAIPSSLVSHPFIENSPVMFSP
jgi:hypothetical protein